MKKYNKKIIRNIVLLNSLIGIQVSSMEFIQAAAPFSGWRPSGQRRLQDPTQELVSLIVSIPEGFREWNSPRGRELIRGICACMEQGVNLETVREVCGVDRVNEILGCVREAADSSNPSHLSFTLPPPSSPWTNPAQQGPFASFGTGYPPPLPPTFSAQQRPFASFGTGYPPSQPPPSPAPQRRFYPQLLLGDLFNPEDSPQFDSHLESLLQDEQNLIHLNTRNRKGHTPLFSCIIAYVSDEESLMEHEKDGRIAQARTLLAQEKIDPNVPELNGVAPIHMAVLCRDMRMLDLLLAHHKINVDQIIPSDGYTALHIAVQQRNLEAVRRLLGRGANLMMPNQDRKTAFELACDLGYGEIVAEMKKVQ
jgi:hypothetical protein